MKLTPIQQIDLPKIQRWLSKESLFYLVTVEPPILDRPYYAFSVKLDDGTLVGWASISNIDLWNMKAEIGFSLPDKRARGRSPALLDRLLDLSFGMLGLNKIRMKIRGENTQALRLAEGIGKKRFGLEKEGVDRNGYNQHGKVDDIHYFGLTKEVWMKYGRGDSGCGGRRSNIITTIS